MATNARIKDKLFIRAFGAKLVVNRLIKNPCSPPVIHTYCSIFLNI
jgi:hypothetical protein